MKTITAFLVIFACIAVALRAFPSDEAPAFFDEVVTKKMIAEREKKIAEHWTAVRNYKEFVSNPDNFKPDPVTGLRVAAPPDPLPSLAYLVSVGELEHVDLVFPIVPKTRKTTRFWMGWGERTDGVWYMTGNPQYVHYEPSGEQPLHLNIWFDRSVKPKVQQLIADLESLAQEGS